MEPNDTAIQMYLRTAARFKLLNREEEIELAKKIQPGAPIKAMRAKLAGINPASDEEVADALKMSVEEMKRIESTALWARNKLVNHNLRMIVAVAKKYQNKGLHMEDLLGEGKFGLILAAEKFDPTRGCKFSTHAHWWIMQSMTRGISEKSNTIRLPIHVTERISKAKKVCRQLGAELGRKPTLEELAERLGWTPEDTYKVLTAKRRVLSLQSMRPSVDDDIPLIERFVDPNQAPALDAVSTEEQREILLDRMRKVLTPQEFKCLVLYFGLDGQAPRPTTKMYELDTSRSRAGALQRKAMYKLRSTAQIGRMGALKEARGVAG